MPAEQIGGGPLFWECKIRKRGKVVCPPTTQCAGTLIYLLLPWFDRSPVKSICYKGPIMKVALAPFVVLFLGLGYLGTLSVTEGRAITAQIFTLVFFAFSLLMPWHTCIDATKQEPVRMVRDRAH